MAKGGGGEDEARANRASFTKEETGALDEGRRRKGTLNKDAAKSKTAGQYQARGGRRRDPALQKQSTTLLEILISR